MSPNDFLVIIGDLEVTRRQLDYQLQAALKTVELQKLKIAELTKTSAPQDTV